MKLPILVLLLPGALNLWAGDLPDWNGSAADYERANKLRELTQNKVFNTNITPHWFAGNTQFWYRRKLAGDKSEFIRVNAEKGTREPAFDHAKVAVALKTAGIVDAQADRLPLDSISFNPDGHVILFLKGKAWGCDLTSYELKPLKDASSTETYLPHQPELKASASNGPDTSITFMNKAREELELYWLDFEGARKSYGRIKPGNSFSINTYVGHVWTLVDSGGKTHGTYKATLGPNTANVTEDPPVVGTAVEKPTTPNISPDGKWEAAFKNHNVIVRNLASNEKIELTTDGREDDAYQWPVHWSPDSNKLVVLKTKAGDKRKVFVVESSPKTQLQPILQSYDYLKPGDQIPLTKPHLFDFVARKEIPVSEELFPNPWEISHVYWIEDSSQFNFFYNQRGHQVLRVIGVDSRSGKARAIIDEQSKTFVDYSGKFFLHRIAASHELIWMSERDGWNHLYLYDEINGNVKNQITKGDWVVRGIENIDEAKRQVSFKACGLYPGQDPYYVHYCRVNLDGSNLIKLTEGDGTHHMQLMTPADTPYFLDVYSRVDLPPVTELRRKEDGKLVCELERGDASELLKTGWTMPEGFVAKGRDGKTDIYGTIMRPSNFKPGKLMPVIENIYAGPTGQFVPKSWSAFYEQQTLAELGFIVVNIDGMGTNWRNKAFHDVAWKNLGDAGFPDRIAWMKAAAKVYPYMDLNRVGIYGGSAGGQNSLRALLAFGDFYKAAASDCGCHDNRMDKIWWNEMWMGWPIGPHYDEQSNVTQAHKLQGKLLLTVGEIDHNVDPASTMQVVNALIKADKDFEFVVIPGGQHGSGESPYGKRRRADFFVRSLMGTNPRGEK